jgi:uncharacterized Zn finger protein
MANISRTWWGQRFLEALEECTDAGRLGRGRAYSKPRRLLEFSIDGTVVTAKLRGNVNPYFGVYEEPRYRVEITLKRIPVTLWTRIVKSIAGNTGWLSRLLLNEMPDDIEQAFTASKYSLLPRTARELNTHCSCPDWANPCKHVAGTYYHMAELLDKDPLLLFQLRGLSREKLQRELRKTPLGKAMATQLEAGEIPVLQPCKTRYPHPAITPPDETMSHREFWGGAPLPPPDTQAKTTGVAALLIKKQGDYPPFWHRDNSFIQAMEQIYEQVRNRNKDSL